MMSSSTDTSQPMNGCPPLEDIAAFLDGTLAADERARLTEHLARCESCYEVFSGAVHFQEEPTAADTGGRGVLPFPLGGEQGRPPRRLLSRSRWALPLAASVVLVAGLGLFRFFAPPQITLAGVVEPLEGSTGLTDRLYQPDVMRGEDEESDFLDRPVVMAGVYLVDLRVSLRENESQAIEDSLRNLGGETQNVLFLGELGEQITAAAEKVAKPGSREEIDRLGKALEASLGDDPAFRLGLWAEAGHIAAASRNSGFFKDRDNRRFLPLAREAVGDLPAEIQDSLQAHLQAIDQEWTGRDFAPLEAHFRGLIEQIDRYRELSSQ
ncbi:MAG TPA: hypothetical protein DD490_10125 [Acidobacteria bacterium]|nr:hypothetical protein [Acidobacteriota bacterium]